MLNGRDSNPLGGVNRYGITRAVGVLKRIGSFA